ncbi:MAG TPA: hypothetical protein VIV15_01690, partial [Anaerolineales bacterium]
MKQLLRRNRQMVLRGLGTLAAVVLIGILIREEGWAEVLAAFKSLPLSRVLIALAFILVSRLFVVTRWYILLRS